MTIPQDPDHEPPPSPTEEPGSGWNQDPEPEMPPGYDEPDDPDEDDPVDEGPPSNVDDDGVNHFAVTTMDDNTPDVCGGCGQTWPCDAAYDLGLAERPTEDTPDPTPTDPPTV